MGAFDALPLELRQAVWKECLPDPTAPEVYFYDHNDFMPRSVTGNKADGPWGVARLKVVVEYPIILHVNHESRCFALRSGFSFRWFRKRLPRSSSEVVEYVLLPCRNYRPETDIFFLGEDIFGHMVDVDERQRNDPTCVFQSIRHLAIGLWHMMDDVAIEFWQANFLCTLPSLRLVSIVFDHYWGLDASKDVKEVKDFRHFRLIPYTDETAMICPGSDEEGLDFIPELGLSIVPDFIQHLNEQLSSIEPQEDGAPWSAKIDGWCFRFFAKKFVLAHH
jgi:hypothetical protein